MRVIWLLLVAAFVAILNETTMAIAVPKLNETLGIPPELGQWLTSAFMLTMAVVIPTTGFLLRRFTTRQIFLAAISLFSLGTLVCLSANGFVMLLTGRIIQASGTGIMLPLLMTTIMNVVPSRQRGRMMGRVGMVIALAPAIGPTLSGFIVEGPGWRWLFAIILPIALLSLGLGAKWMTNLGETTHAPIDVLSIILSALGFGGLVYGLSRLGSHGEVADGAAAGAAQAGGPGILPFVFIGAGLVVLAVFVLRQLSLQKRDAPLLDLRVFLTANFSIAVVMMTVVAVAMFGTLSLLPVYMHDVLSLNAQESGLVLLPGALIMGLLGPVMGRMYDAFGPKPLLIPGTILIASALFVYSQVEPGTSPYLIAGVQTVLSVGLAASMTPLMSASLGSLARPLYSHGSASLNTMQQVGGAIGTALLVALYSSRLHSGVSEGMSVADAGAPGGQTAFLIAGCIALVPVVLAFFIRRPAEEDEPVQAPEAEEPDAAPLPH
ncbi:putative transport protein [Actinomycetales bacterium JB111]|nr:putative transport protein [Actinomycetales bacterium JB111]